MVKWGKDFMVPGGKALCVLNAKSEVGKEGRERGNGCIERPAHPVKQTNKQNKN